VRNSSKSSWVHFPRPCLILPLHGLRPSGRLSDVLACWLRGCADFRHFLDWCAFYDLPMPADGKEVANYLLELLVDGATLPDLKRAAASIAACYEQRHCFLDQRPIRAAIAMATAQTSPNRVIN
jgi:hypothetical protein